MTGDHVRSGTERYICRARSQGSRCSPGAAGRAHGSADLDRTTRVFDQPGSSYIARRHRSLSHRWPRSTRHRSLSLSGCSRSRPPAASLQRSNSHWPSPPVPTRQSRCPPNQAQLAASRSGEYSAKPWLPRSRSRSAAALPIRPDSPSAAAHPAKFVQGAAVAAGTGSRQSDEVLVTASEPQVQAAVTDHAQ